MGGQGTDGLPLVARLAEELKELARIRNTVSASEADLPVLRQLASLLPGDGGVAEGELDRIHRLVSVAADRLDDAHRDAAIIIFGDGPDRFIHTLRARREDAGVRVGLSEASFRKKRSDGKSPYDLLAQQLAEAIVSVSSDPAPSGVTLAEAPDRRSRRPLVWLVAALVLAVAAVWVWVSSSDLSEASSAKTHVADVSVSTVVSMTTAGATLSAATGTDAHGEPFSDSGIEYGTPLDGCNIPLAAAAGQDLPSDAALRVAGEAFATEAHDRGLGCPSGLMTRWGGLWVQPVEGPRGVWCSRIPTRLGRSFSIRCSMKAISGFSTARTAP